MKAFKLVEVEGYENILFSSSFIAPEALYKFTGGEKLAFYEVYEFMPVIPPLEPIIRGIYNEDYISISPIKINFEKELVSFDLNKERIKVKEFCNVLVDNIDDLFIQLDLYLLYYSIGIDLDEIKDNIKPIFEDEKEIIMTNIYNENKEKFSLHLKQYKGKVLFIIKKESYIKI